MMMNCKGSSRRHKNPKRGNEDVSTLRFFVFTHFLLNPLLEVLHLKSEKKLFLVGNKTTMRWPKEYSVVADSNYWRDKHFSFAACKEFNFG